MTSLSKNLSFVCFNVAQFLGAFNDNLLKLLFVFFIVSVSTSADINDILAYAGVLFVSPFLLFSHLAGEFSDRHSKKWITVGTKVLECFITLASVVAFFYQWVLLSYLLVFLMALQSALFGPSKYGIISELVPENLVHRANGIVTLSTYLAIVMGTLSASFLTGTLGMTYIHAGFVCFIVSIVGLTCSLMISTTSSCQRVEKIQVFFLRDMWNTLRFCESHFPLLICIASGALFFFVASFLQLNLIPFGFQELGINQTAGGYLFFLCAVGIAMGSALAGFLDQIPPFPMAALGALGMTLSVLGLGFVSHSLLTAVILLVSIGFSAGFFLVPMSATLQKAAPPSRKGKILAVDSFCSFIGTLCASCLLYGLGVFGGRSAVIGCRILSVFLLLLSLSLLRFGLDQFLHFYSCAVHGPSSEEHFSNENLPSRSRYICSGKWSWNVVWSVSRKQEVYPCVLCVSPFRSFLLRCIGFPAASGRPELERLLKDSFWGSRKVLIFAEDWGYDKGECSIELDEMGEAVFGPR